MCTISIFKLYHSVTLHISTQEYVPPIQWDLFHVRTQQCSPTVLVPNKRDFCGKIYKPTLNNYKMAYSTSLLILTWFLYRTFIDIPSPSERDQSNIIVIVIT